jgi:predicted TIM-barrel fold metal-dependent hydrolase
MIIDVHMHLGDILHTNGGKTIYQDVEMPKRFNIQRFEEDILSFNRFSITNAFFEKYDDLYTKSVSDRIKAGTFQNLRNYYQLLETTSQEWFGDNKVRSFCMPVSPHVTFFDIDNVTKEESRLKTFTSINPLLSMEDACSELRKYAPYSYGLKLHPIIQGIPFDSERTYRALKIMNELGKPVLLHAGASRYYLGDEERFQHCELDDPHAAEVMIKQFPDTPFIIGHAGIAEYQEWARLLRKYDNIYYDITVQPIKAIKELMNWYGEDRMLFATDWPCVNPRTTLRIVRKAMSDNQLIKLMYKNALDLFGKNILE